MSSSDPRQSRGSVAAATKRTQPLIESEHTGREEVRQRRFDAAQFLHVRNEPPALDSKNEVPGTSDFQASKLDRRAGNRSCR